MPKDTLIIILSLIGLINAWHLHYQYKRQQKTGQKMYCAIGKKCDEVIGSKFGTTIGIKNEILGMTYYIIITLLSLTNLLFPNTILHLQFSILHLLTFLAFIFSLYLLIIQTVILRKICSWCLIAISINTAIFIISLL